MFYRRSALLSALALPVLLPAGMASAATLTVGSGGTYAKIQDAVNASVSGDIIQVNPGTYNENVNFGGRAITVQSTGGRDVTTINAGGTGSAVTFNSGETSSALLIGFTLRGAANSGVNVFVGSAPLIRGCRMTANNGSKGGGANIWGAASLYDNEFIGNVASEAGGGLYLNNISARVEGNVFRDNDAASGGGIYIAAGSVSKAVVSGNDVSGYGGGIYATAGASITNVFVVENTATYGGGVHVANGTTVRMTNDTIADNQATGTFGAGGGIHIASGASASLRNLIVAGNSAATGGGIYSDGSNPGQFYLDVWGNTASNFGGNAVNPAGANGNKSVDPMFSSSVAWALLSGSPCIDAGDPARSYEDPDGSLNDMGAYGGPAADWTPYADADGDGVHLADGDCDDLNSGNFPGNLEVCDGMDNNCDAVIDEGLNNDDDGDSFTECDGDCDDADPGVFPGNVEIPDDGVDQDCDGADDHEGGCTQSRSPGAGALALGLLGLLAVVAIRRR